MAELQLHFLGRFQVTRDQRPVTGFESDKVRALLAYLAIEAAYAQPRTALTALLWPDYDENSARGSLRQALYQLRQVLGDGESRPPLLLITRQTLQFNPAVAQQCDAITFTTLLQQYASHKHSDRQACDTCLARLRQAVELYQGEFLAGFAIADSAPFEEWRRIKQEQFHLQALDALITLAHVDETRGEIEGAQHYVRRQLRLEPWREEAHRQLMRLLSQQGQRAAALAQYQQCQQVLRKELGLEPTIETKALYEQIRAGALHAPPLPSAAIVKESTSTDQTVSPPERFTATLPEPLTPFVGREKELAEVITALQQADNRLLTLVGSGGMGKTRLALQAAKKLCAQPVSYTTAEDQRDHDSDADTAFPDGIFFIPLASLQTMTELAPTMATIVGINLANVNPTQALCNFLHDKQCLLILDNFEHLLEGTPLLVELLQRAPKVRMLVTSRARLNIQGETLYPMQGMDYAVGDSLPVAATSSAVRLFIQSVRRIQPTFKLAETNYTEVLALCQAVQGMPLGLELAAVWIEHLSLTEICQEIQQSTDFLAADWQHLPERQRSLRAVFTWSWQMLGENEQQALRQLTVFRGSFTREAAQAVAGVALRTLTTLVDKSLVTMSALGRRYEIHEMLRQFAAEQLDALPTERATVERRHSTYYLTFVSDRELRLARNEPRQAANEIQQELSNIRQAWLYAANQCNSPLLGQSVVGLARYYDLSGLLHESIQNLGQAAHALAQGTPILTTGHQSPQAQRQVQQQILSKLWAIQAGALVKQGKFDEGLTIAQQAIHIGSAYGGFEGETYGQLVVGQASLRKGHYEEARHRFTETLQLIRRYQQEQPPNELLHDAECTTHIWLGGIAADAGNFGAAQAHFADGIQICQRYHNQRFEVRAQLNLADLLRRMGDYPAARRIYEACLPITRALGYDWGEGAIYLELGDTMRLLGEYTAAQQLCRAAEVQLSKIGATFEYTISQLLLARLHCYCGDYTQAEQGLEQVRTLPMVQEPTWLKAAWHLVSAGHAYVTGRGEAARTHAEEASNLGRLLQLPLMQAEGFLLLGHALLSLQQSTAARQPYEQAQHFYQQLGHQAAVAEAQAGLALSALAAGEKQQALAGIAPLIPWLQSGKSIGLDEPFFVYLACYRVLSALQDTRAGLVLADAHDALQRYTAQIDDAAVRKAFLEEVPIHRELYNAYQAAQQLATLTPVPLLPVVATAAPIYHWGEMPAGEGFVGRTAELAQMQQWLTPEGTTPRARLVSILGIGGVGKTTVAAALVKTVAPAFTVVIWRSLLNAPPLESILSGWLQILDRQRVTALPTALDQQILLLLSYLREQRVLLILDNVESILESGAAGAPAGSMRPGYEAYGHLFQHLSKSDHQSTLLLTSREQPAGLPRPNHHTSDPTNRVHTLALTGLDLQASQTILHNGGLHPSAQEVALLVHHYSGNPLALQIVATTIADFFGGSIADFQREEGFIFDNIRSVLDQQFARLSLLEKAILCWLAIERESITVSMLRANFAQAVPMPALLSALHGLQARSLIEKSGEGLTLQNVIIEYTTEYLVEQIYQEILDWRLAIFDVGGNGVASKRQTQNTKLPTFFLNRFALLKAQAKEYVRQSQARVLLRPVADRLVATEGKPETVARLQDLITQLQHQAATGPDYAAGNLLNLLIYLNGDLTGYDFSRLVIRQAYLCGVNLHQTNFTQSHLESSVFSDAFRAVNVVAFYPDGQRLAAGTSTGSVRFWQVSDWQPIGLLNAHTEAVNTLAFSPAGDLMVTGSDDATVRLWAVESGQLLGVLRGHGKGVKSVAFSPDGTCLASGGQDNTVYIWDVAQQRMIHRLLGHTRVVAAVSFSPDGATLASASWDRTIQLWDVASGQWRATLRGHERGIIGLSFSPDGQLLVSGSWDRSVRLWAVGSGKLLQQWQGHTRAVRSVLFSHDGATVISASEDTTIRLWRVADGQVMRILSGHSSWISSLALSPDQRTLVSSSWDQSIGIWSLANSQLYHVLYGYTGQMLDVAMTACCEQSAALIASAGEDGTIRLWTPKLIKTQRPPLLLYGHTDAVSAVAFSPDGHWLASGSWDQSVRLWHIGSQTLQYRLTGHTDDVNSVIFSPDGRWLASASDDHTALVWEVQTGQPYYCLADHPTGITWLAYSHDSRHLAGIGSNQQIALWQMSDGALVEMYASEETHGERLRGLSFTDQGHLLTVVQQAGALRLWDVLQRCPLRALQAAAHEVNECRFSADGTLLAGYGQQPLITIWSVATGQIVQILQTTQFLHAQSHSQGIRSLRFSADNAYLITGSFDETVRIWAVATGACLHVLSVPTPYTGMNITGVTGISEAQRAALKALGAIETALEP